MKMLNKQFLTLYFSMTLTQTEKGYPPPIEHVGIPASIRNEKGWLEPEDSLPIRHQS